MGINTGNGGFEFEGKTQTYDVGDPDQQAPVPPVHDRGDIPTTEEGHDLSKRTKETLGRYVGGQTQQNSYPVDSAQTIGRITTVDGLPAVNAVTNSSKFTEDSLNLQHELPVDLHNGDRFVEKTIDPKSALRISKGKTDPRLTDGHSVLPEIAGGSPGRFPQGISGYVSTVLSNNRFTASARSTQTDILRPSNAYNSTLKHPKYGEVSTSRLSQVGVSLTLRSSQELGATGDGNNPSSGGQEAKSLLPGLNQLGVSRVSTALLEARDVLETLTSDEVPEGNIISASPGGSWGSLNNSHDPYSGLNAIGMIALSAALTAAMVVLFEGLGFLLSLIKGGDKSGAAKNVDGRYALGRYHLVQGPNPSTFPPTSFPPDIGAMLGINPTVNPFSEALQVGIASFFGIDRSSGILGRLTSGLVSATSTPGFNVTVSRSIIRSSITTIDEFKKAFKSPNLIAGVQNTLSILDVIRSSKLISAMNVFATLGDHVLVTEQLDESVSGLDGEGNKQSKIDRLDDSTPAVQKNRLNGSLKLAWASNRSPTSYLIPDPLLTLSAVGGRLGSFQTLPGLQTPLAKNYFKVISLTEQVKTSLRLPYDSADPTDVTVKSIEGKLDAEYMPFYFHDLRTNEIISFHAFITSLTESFSPTWESSEGYGRVDAVKVYKNTTRRISVSFMIVATSDEDFDDMWTKINKLVTLVYPQYTSGRTLSDTDSNNTFTQPFSQMIGASPLIRMRLGDLFRSNYSRFALSRLFGADNNTMKLNGTDVRFQGGVDGFEKLKSAFQNLIKNPKGERFLLSTNNLSGPSESGSVSLSLPSIPGVKSTTNKRPPSFNVPAGDAIYFLHKVERDLDDKRVVVSPELMPIQMMQQFLGLSTTSATDMTKHLKSEYDNPNKPAKRFVGGQYVAQRDTLRVSPDKFSTLVKESFGASSDNIEALSDFLNPDKNAVVKSFKETQGKGLAGTIDNLDFDHNGVTWETTPGRRAPQFVKVSITFTPLHDISPGLDSQGFNRAPIYPVGHFAHGLDE